MKRTERSSFNLRGTTLILDINKIYLRRLDSDYKNSGLSYTFILRFFASHQPANLCDFLKYKSCSRHRLLFFIITKLFYFVKLKFLFLFKTQKFLDVYAFAFAPEFFELIIISGFAVKYMHENRIIIYYYPVGAFLSAYSRRLNIRFFF